MLRLLGSCWAEPNWALLGSAQREIMHLFRHCQWNEQPHCSKLLGSTGDAMGVGSPHYLLACSAKVNILAGLIKG